MRTDQFAGINVVITFHIPLPFENDEGVTPAAAVLVTNDSYTLNGPKTFEFTSEITVCRVFWLEDACQKRSLSRKDATNQTGDEQGLVRVSHGFRVLRGLVYANRRGLAEQRGRMRDNSTGVFGDFELVLFSLFSLLPANLTFGFLGMGKRGILAILHIGCLPRAEHTCGLGFLQLLE